jgi:glycosyltransferase involved in cell wall biosynthesis
MSNAKALCLNMIVKNEMANLERCLSSVADHIDCWVIGDTGSTDGTQDFIHSFFAARKIPGELHSFPFHNFEQARNAGLDCAYGSKLVYDYLLFDDADMELVVEDHDFRSKLTAPSYTVLQRSGISYWNTRLVRRSVGARYRGVTHEYVDVPGGGGQQLQGIWYKDHASGSNRVDKFERDIRLLKEGLEKEPESTRYWFYLAQSYRDAGQTEKAAEAYAKRAGMGGWDEEAWYARLQQARCLRKLGDEGGFVREALAAFNQRPQRAEPLHDLAKYYREKGSNDASLLFAESGLAIERPNDILFLEDFVYTAGLKEEYSIAANYSRDPVRKDRGHAACNWLALSRTAPEGTRNLARSNLYFYVESAATMMPSFSPRQVAFTPPDGYRASNPSITRRDDEILMVQRCVNYTVSEDARHYHTRNNEPIQTRNFLLRLSDDLETRSSTEILLPADMPEPSFKAVLGFEDMRLFAWRNELWTCSTIREQNPEGYCEQVLARLEDKEPGPYRLSNWRVLRPNAPRRHEKNWMPHVVGKALQFMYLCDPTHVIDEQARTVSETTPPIMGGDFRGGSQLIEFDGGWLTLIHEVIFRDGARIYLHRFVWFDKADSLKRVSRLFFFQKKGIEFAAGLAWHPDGSRLIASYGVGDGESWMATIDADDVRKILDDAERLPWGGPKPNSERKVTEVPHLSIAPAISPLGTDVDHGDIGEANLSAIFRRSGTDKVINGYAGLYEALFSKGRREIRRILEIGIGTMIPGAPSSMVGFAPEGYKPGASLRAWREFFPNATIYGADIQPDTQFSDEERIVTVLCNSSDADQVKQLMSKLNNEQFDIIIDDGSHILENQLKTLRNLYPFLKSGGFYIVEDCGHNGLAKQADAIREICGDIAFFGAGPYENPFVLTKRPDGRLAENNDPARVASRSSASV